MAATDSLLSIRCRTVRGTARYLCEELIKPFSFRNPSPTAQCVQCTYTRRGLDRRSQSPSRLPCLDRNGERRFCRQHGARRSPLRSRLFGQNSDVAPTSDAGEGTHRGGADVNARGANNRTALHWAVIGLLSRNAAQASQRQVYMDVIEDLIAREADLNAEDDFGHTVLDWNEVVENEELEELLLVNGAERGRSLDESLRIKVFTN